VKTHQGHIVISGGKLIDGTGRQPISQGAVHITDGRITQVTYTYILAGVQYESSQALNLSQQERSNDYAPGKQIVIRYDPRRPANSIVV